MIRRSVADQLLSLANSDCESVLKFLASRVVASPGVLSPEAAGMIASHAAITLRPMIEIRQ